MNNILIVGTIALDDIDTPFGSAKKALGGSATYCAFASSLFSPTSVVSIIGNDFPADYLKKFARKKINTESIIKIGKTFRWQGSYQFDMGEAKTIKTQINNLKNFKPKLSKSNLKSKYILVANVDPQIQLDIINQIRPLTGRIIMADTMDYWISNKRKDLMCVIEKIDILLLNDNEARQLFDEPNLIRAGRKALNAGPEYVIIKKGEHGALAFANDWFFSAPSYPLENLIDPTGAGDSFAGALIGCLAKAKKFERKNIKKAIIYASAVASFVAEDFSTKKLEKINTKQIEERFLIFKKIREF